MEYENSFIKYLLPKICQLRKNCNFGTENKRNFKNFGSQGDDKNIFILG